MYATFRVFLPCFKLIPSMIKTKAYLHIVPGQIQLAVSLGWQQSLSMYTMLAKVLSSTPKEVQQSNKLIIYNESCTMAVKTNLRKTPYMNFGTMITILMINGQNVFEQTIYSIIYLLIIFI